MELAAFVEVSSKLVTTRSKARKNTKKIKDRCNKENNAKQVTARRKARKNSKMLNSKFFGALMYFLKNGSHSHMLNFVSSDVFKVKFVHQRSPNWTPDHISLFKEMDIIMKGERYLSQQNYNEKSKVRFKSNMRKMVKTAGYLSELKQDKSNKMRSITEIYYQILKNPESSEVGNVSTNADVSNVQMYGENVIRDLTEDKTIIMEGYNISEESDISENNAGQGYLTTAENGVFQTLTDQTWMIQNAVTIDFSESASEETLQKREVVAPVNQTANATVEHSHEVEEIEAYYTRKVNLATPPTTNMFLDVTEDESEEVICINNSSDSMVDNYISREENAWEGRNIEASNVCAGKVCIYSVQNNSRWDIHEGNEDNAKPIDIHDGQQESRWKSVKGNQEDSQLENDIYTEQNNSILNTVWEKNPLYEENVINIVKVAQNANMNAVMSWVKRPMDVNNPLNEGLTMYGGILAENEVNNYTAFSVVPSSSNINIPLQDEEVTCRRLIAENKMILDNDVMSLNDIALPVVSSSLEINSSLQNKENLYGEIIPDTEVSLNNDAWQSITGYVSRLGEKDAMKSSSNPFLPNVCSDDNSLLDTLAFADSDEMDINGF